MTSTVLVTGGSGFIGTWVLKELLADGCRVVVYDRNDGGTRWQQLLGEDAARIEFVAGDILDKEALAAVFARYPAISNVIHLAAWLTPPCQQDPYRGCEINVLGTMRLFEQIRALGGQVQGFAYASSIGVFGREPDDAEPHAGPPSEADLLEPETFYGAFKRANELIAKQYWRHFRIPSVGLRPFVVYGPGREQGLTAAPTLAARAVARHEPFAFSFSGSTGYEFVRDTARAFVRSAREVSAGCYVAAVPAQAASVEDIIALLDTIKPGSANLLSVSGPPLPYPILPQQFMVDRLFPDWQSTALEEGLRETVAFYEAAP